MILRVSDVQDTLQTNPVKNKTLVRITNMSIRVQQDNLKRSHQFNIRCYGSWGHQLACMNWVFSLRWLNWDQTVKVDQGCEKEKSTAWNYCNLCDWPASVFFCPRVRRRLVHQHVNPLQALIWGQSSPSLWRFDSSHADLESAVRAE